MFFGIEKGSNLQTYLGKLLEQTKVKKIFRYFDFKSTFKKKWALLNSLCRPSSVRPSVRYFLAGIAPTELKF
jgi:hypothetical protein